MRMLHKVCFGGTMPAVVYCRESAIYIPKKQKNNYGSVAKNSKKYVNL
jgi:hypothetical protein